MKEHFAHEERHMRRLNYPGLERHLAEAGRRPGRSGFTSLARHGMQTALQFINRHGLEATACECYGVVRKEMQRLRAGTLH